MHEMTLETTYPTGAEEWVCPTCGRRFVTIWNPYQRVVLEPGDESAPHSGGNGGVKIGVAVESPAPEPEGDLSAFRDFIEGADMSDL